MGTNSYTSHHLNKYKNKSFVCTLYVLLVSLIEFESSVSQKYFVQYQKKPCRDAVCYFFNHKSVQPV